MYEWDLTPFYPSFESEAFKQDGAKLFVMVDELIAFFNHPDAKTKVGWFLEEVLKKTRRFTSFIITGDELHYFALVGQHSGL